MPARRLLAGLLGAVLVLAACGETNGRDETSPQAEVPGAEVDDDFTDTDIDLPEAEDDAAGGAR